MENGLVDRTHDFRGDERARLTGRQRPRGTGVVLARTLTLVCEQRLDGIRLNAATLLGSFSHQIVFTAVEGAKILQRDVHAALREVARNVSKNIRQLQGNAEIRRVLFRGRGRRAKNIETDQSNRRCDADAVLVEIGERLVPTWTNVHFDAFDEPVEVAFLQCERRNERCERPPLRRSRFTPLEARSQFGTPPSDFLVDVPFVAFRRVVNRVVDRPTEIPHGDDRPTLVLGKDEKRVIKIRVASHVDASAPGRCLCEQDQQITTGQCWPLEQGIGRSVHFIEDAPTAEPRHAQLPLEPARDGIT